MKAEIYQAMVGLCEGDMGTSGAVEADRVLGKNRDALTLKMKRAAQEPATAHIIGLAEEDLRQLPLEISEIDANNGHQHNNINDLLDLVARYNLPPDLKLRIHKAGVEFLIGLSEKYAAWDFEGGAIEFSTYFYSAFRLIAGIDTAMAILADDEQKIALQKCREALGTKAVQAVLESARQATTSTKDAKGSLLYHRSMAQDRLQQLQRKGFDATSVLLSLEALYAQHGLTSAPQRATA